MRDEGLRSTPAKELVLASASPSRARILRGAGIAFTQRASDVDEERLEAELTQARPTELAQALARAKAHAVAAELAAAEPSGAASLVLGCDSLLVLDGLSHGKPHTAQEATRRWLSQRGRTAELVTGHCLIDLAHGARAEAVISAAVTFADATDEEIADYVATGEPLGVAGAFTLEGRAGPLIERIDGDPSNVLGLSLPGLRRLLAELGYRLRDVAG